MGQSNSEFAFDSNVTIISIDGNIGSGKSTLLEKLREHYLDNKDIIFLREPVSDWESIIDSSGKTMIDKFYDNKQQYSFSFQMMAYISRLAILRETIRNNVAPNDDRKICIITERSLFTDRHVFAKMLYDEKCIEDVNYQIYLKWFNEFANDFPVYKIIYVDTNAKTCHERINKRARTGEEQISLDYLINCDRYHKDYVASMSCGVIVLDGNNNIYENGSILDKWIADIDSMLYVR